MAVAEEAVGSNRQDQVGESTRSGQVSPVPRPIYENITELIGNTPLLKLSNLDKPEGVNIYAKLEYDNPGGSVKDRVAQFMLRDAAASGKLAPGGTIIEATAGNMGLGIATAAFGSGYRIIFVVPTKFSAEKQSLMRALGAEVINTPRKEGMLGACRKVEELLDEIPGSISLKQFENLVNPLAHYATTGPEIYRDLAGKVDYFVAGAGSGGTFSGIVRYLKERNPAIRGVLADPVGSTIGGGEHGDYDIEGIGNDFTPATMDMSLVDQVIKVTDRDAVAVVKLLARQEAIIAGSSSGAAVWASLELANELVLLGVASAETPVNIVTVLPDRGDRYLSKGLFE
ncbi:MAG: cysteine synthase family protein [Coriobacteriales bacterium]|jgi:cysteine synthase A|nr:cysteine synthase family protein [Coriobacteriales bacterium]